MSRRFELLVARDHTAADRLVIAPVELPFMGERENVSREVQMVEVVGFLMVIGAYMALPNDGVWAVGRLIANKLERRRIVLLFNSKTSGKTAPQTELTRRARFGSSEHALPLQLHLLPEVRVSDSSSGSNQWPRPYAVDRRLYEDFWNWLAAKLPDRCYRGADIAAGDMYDFLEWIRETNRPPMADRIARPSLDTDMQAYAADYIGRDVPAIGGFRNRLLNLRDMLRDLHFENWARESHVMFQGFDGAGPSSGSRSSSHNTDSSGSNQGPGPSDVDLPLYEDFWNWLTEKLPNRRSRGANHAADDMSDFLKWIRETNRPPMLTGLHCRRWIRDIQAYAGDYIGRDSPTIGGFRNRLLNLRDMLRDFHHQVQFENWARARGRCFRGSKLPGHRHHQWHPQCRRMDRPLQPAQRLGRQSVTSELMSFPIGGAALPPTY
ncbi:hypothetical protein [Bradyrhizobium algeriense]|uniref:hypothetical protein n=1 Tax=Bradyrhizobium algeriense TaxID=634784 RepID=UPI000D3B92B9|nr:hypothetical protein [Bradyrhizobium algeriense]